MLEEYARGTKQVRKATSDLAEVEVLVAAVAVAMRVVIAVGRDSGGNVRGCTDGCKGIVRVSHLTKLEASLSPRTCLAVKDNKGVGVGGAAMETVLRQWQGSEAMAETGGDGGDGGSSERRQRRQRGC